MNLFSLQEVSMPSVAVEFAATHVSGARLESRGGQPVITAWAVESLPDGALVASLSATNVVDRAAVEAALGRVLDQVGRPRRIALVIPDLTVKIAILKFEQVPPRAQDLDQVVRWQMRKTAPFAIEDAQLSYSPGVRGPEGQEFVVSLARRDIVEEYEGLVAAEGAHAGVVDVATLNVVNAVLAGPGPTASQGGDQLIVNLASDSATLVVLRGTHVIFYRNRATDADGVLVDLVHQTAMYYEDRLAGQGFSRAVLAGSRVAARAADVETVRGGLQGRFAATVAALDLASTVSLTDRIAGASASLDRLAPLAGMLLRARENAA